MPNSSPAIGPEFFAGISGGISDLAGYFGAETKSRFDIAEAQSYDEAAQLARQNEEFTKMSTAIQEAQTNRELSISMGRTTAEVAGAGFSLSGSALDILRESAAQGSLQKAVISEQGLIQEAGFAEQAQSYSLMASAARQAASAEGTAGLLDLGSAALSGIAGIASLFPK
jgi:hypothetical protein